MSSGQLVGLGGLVGLAILPALAALVWGWFKLADLLATWRHRARVREAIRQGWTEPTMSGNWEVRDNGAPLYGVTGIERTPDLGVRITHYGAHARKIQRDVERAWLAGIDRGKVSHEAEERR